MPVFAATDHKITINGTNFSDRLQSVTLDVTADELESTAFGVGWRTRIGGLKSGQVTLNFLQDFGASSVDAVLWPLVGSNGTVVITPTSGSTTATNPAYTAVCLVTQYQPFASNVGDIATLSVTWPTTGTVARATA